MKNDSTIRHDLQDRTIWITDELWASFKYDSMWAIDCESQEWYNWINDIENGFARINLQQ